METLTKIQLTAINTDQHATVTEVLVRPGLLVDKGQPVIILDLEGEVHEVKSPFSGKVADVFISGGDTIRKKDLIATLFTENTHLTARPQSSVPSATADHQKKALENRYHAELVVIGGGPGGYNAAFRAADLGIKTVLVERHATLGGVCLNVGCIPSKALLHLSGVIEETAEAGRWGLNFNTPKLDLEGIRSWKSGVVAQLSSGLEHLAKKRKVTVVKGVASFKSQHSLTVRDGDSTQELSFNNAIIAAGSSPCTLPDFPGDPRIMTSTGVLQLKSIPDRFLIIGGGVVGMELATAYHAFGSKITVVDENDRLIASADRDLIKPLYNYAQERFSEIHLSTRIATLTATATGIIAEFESDKAIKPAEFDLVLVAIGRLPNSGKIGLENTGIALDEKGFIIVDEQQRTNIDHLFAIGDITGNPMLAHKAAYEGKIAAETVSGMFSIRETRTIPFVAYTNPEIAWVGKTENELKARQIPYEKTAFPWTASGRSLTMGRSEGMTKIIFEPDSGVILGAGITGPNASELIAQMALSIETGCSARDLAQTIHPHPTLSESLSTAAEIFEGTVTDLYLPKSKSTPKN